MCVCTCVCLSVCLHICMHAHYVTMHWKITHNAAHAIVGKILIVLLKKYKRSLWIETIRMCKSEMIEDLVKNLESSISGC